MFCIGAIAAIVLVSTLSVLVIINQRAEVTTLRNQVVTQAGMIAHLNSTEAATSDRLTFLAEKLNPLLTSRCHVDQIFYSAREIPENYTGYVLVVPDYATEDYVGLGVICR